MDNKITTQKFILSRQYLTLFFGFVFVALFTMTYTQNAMTDLGLTINEIVMRQLLFALAGFMILTMSIMSGDMIFDKNNRLEPKPLDAERGWLLWGFLAMVGARVAGMFVTLVPLSSVAFLSGSIALTSAIFEEPIFCGMGLMFYIIIKKLPNSNENMAIVGSTLTVSIMFAAIHIGVYGLSIPTMLYLVVGRAIYNLVFLKTRTMLTSTVAHLGHNFLVSFMGI